MSWTKISDVKPPQHSTIITYGTVNNDGVGQTICTHSDGIFRHWETEKENKHTITHWKHLDNDPIEKCDDELNWFRDNLNETDNAIIEPKLNLIVLPTENDSCIMLYSDNTILGDWLFNSTNNFKKTVLCSPHHLHVISNDVILQNDFWINLDNNEICKGKNYYLANNAPSCKKILMSTDSTLKIEDEDYDANDATWARTPKSIKKPNDEFLNQVVSLMNKKIDVKDIVIKIEQKYELIQKGGVGFPEDDISWWVDKLVIKTKK